MGTIAEKLTYLNETKNAIKEAIVNKGVSVNDSDTFRSYADKISSIEAGGGSGGDAEVEASFISSIDNSLGANVTKLPSSLTSIGSRAFYQSTNLALTKLPSGVTSIGDYAFYGCSKLALTELPNGITSIGRNAFQTCGKITLIKLPSNLTSVGNNAFEYCSKLALTELPSSLTSIGDVSFGSCSLIVSLDIKGDVTNIGDGAFRSCSNLATVIFPNVTSVPKLGGTTVFQSTPIAKGTGYIYVPDALVESFKTAIRWTTYANQIKGLSELES